MARGNPAMKAKRVTGPSAQEQLRIVVANARCSAKGCTERPVITVLHSAVRTERKCAAHAWKEQVQEVATSKASAARSWHPW